MLKRVISGGQMGADVGGLLAARKAGLETGGWAPLGWRTENGPKPELAEFGLMETKSSSYIPRTLANVHDGDGTIRFAANFQSPGEKVTLQGIQLYDKVHIDVDLNDPRPVEEVVQWIQENDIKTLNVAGNRESVRPGTEEFVVTYLSQVFEGLK